MKATVPSITSMTFATFECSAIAGSKWMHEHHLDSSRLYLPGVSTFVALVWNLRSIIWCRFTILLSQSVVVAAAKNVPSCIVCALCLFTYGKYFYIFVKGLNFSNENLVVPLIRFSVFVWEYCVLHLGLLGLTGPAQETGYDLPCSLMRNIRTLIIYLQMDL